MAKKTTKKKTTKKALGNPNRRSFRCNSCEQKFSELNEQTEIMRPWTDGDTVEVRVCELCAKKIDKYNVATVSGLLALQKMKVPKL